MSKRAEGRSHSTIPIAIRFIVVGGLLIASFVLRPTNVGAAQVATNITSSGLGTTITQTTGTNYDITGGTRRGSNLFQSFGFFDVGAGDTANFLNDTGLFTSNILGRVTGGNPSNIFGTIKTTGFGTAHLFLLNPFGWIFGPSASLDVGGSFYVSTADVVRFPDGVFSARETLPLPANGLTANPLAFGFLSANPTRITISGSSLQVPTGETLSVVGGEAPFAGQTESGLKIAGVAAGSATPTLRAPSGRVQVVSVASPGDVATNGDVGAFAQLGSIDLSNGARLDVSGVNGPGGTVVIRGGQLSASQASRVIANTTGGTDGAATAVDIQVTGDMSFAGVSGIDVRTSGAGASGETKVAAGNLDMKEGSFIQTITTNGGAGGDISVNVQNATFRSSASISTLSDRVVRPPPAVTTDGGPGGDVTLVATDSVVIDGASSGLTSTTLSRMAGGVGTGGRLSISTASLTLDNSGGVRTTSSGTGAGGDLMVQVGDLSMANGATFRSRTINAQGGDVTVTTTGSDVTISGSNSGIFSGSSGAGSVGEITVAAGQLTLAGGLIQSGTSLDPAGGNVTVTATESIVISDGGGISSQARSQNVGQVAVSAPSLLIDNGFISASTVGIGDAGDILTNVGTLTLTNGGQISSSSELTASGAGGNVNVIADSVSISGQIPSDFVFGPNDVRQLNPDPHSGIFSTASGSGSGGSINVHAGQGFNLSEGGTLSAQSTGTETATAGNITINTPTFQSQGGIVTTGAALADGGNISINTTGSLVHLIDSQITTSVESGVGGGGNITINSTSVVLNNSQILANAFGGPGGNITITADVFLVNSGGMIPSSLKGIVDASSALSTPGTVNIEATFTNVTGSVTLLPETPLKATELLRAACAARFAGGKTSSLVVGGRDGIPLQPGDLSPSPLYLAGDAGTPSTGNNVTGQALPTRFSLLGSKDRLSHQYSLLPNVKCSL
jgi:filamentous hemagglutinin family protein